MPRPAELIALAEEIGGPRALPETSRPAYTTDDYETLLRIEQKAAAVGIRLHQTWQDAIGEAHEWRKRGAA